MSSRCWWLSDQVLSMIHELDLLLVFNPDAARHALQRYGYEGRVQVVPNTLIEFDDASPSIERDGTAPVIGCISRLSAEKGIEYLLASFGLLLEELPDALLDIWGVGEDEGRLRLLAKMLGIESSVRFKGSFEPFRGINAVAAEADVFVLSSLFEGAPVVLLELAALSRPVVATATSGSRWVCGDDYEWLVPIGDTRRMATALAQLLASDSKRNRAGRELQMRAQAHFSHRQAVSAICSAYCQVAGKVMRK
jgi:glycosyltransferase involved in cell wall biosynthesis